MAKTTSTEDLEKVSPINKLLDKINPVNGYRYVEQLVTIFGKRLMLMLFFSYLCVMGAMKQMIETAELPYYKEAHVDAERTQINNIIASVPMSLKGVIAVVSDLFPIGRYRKRNYLIIYCTLSLAACIALVFLPRSFIAENPLVPAFLFLCMELQAASLEIFCQGKYVEQMRLKPGSKGNVITFVWLCLTFGGIPVTVLIGPMADFTEARYVFIVAIPLVAQTFIFLYTGCIIDDDVPPDRSFRFDKENFYTDPKIIVMALITAVGASFIALFAQLFSIYVQLGYVVCGTFIVGLSGYFLLPPAVNKVVIFMMIETSCYANLQTLLSFFYTADASCLPDGPQFSYTYYSTYSQIVSAIATFLGIYAYQVIMSQWKITNIFLVTSLIRIVASGFDLILIYRVNIMVGISDEVAYMLGHAIIFKLVDMMQGVTSQILIAKACPKRLEVTAFSVIAGSGNFGVAIAKLYGIFLIDLFGIVTLPEEGKPCDFSNLGPAVIVGHFIMPLLIIPCIYLLIPSKTVNEQFMEEPAGTDVASNEITPSRESSSVNAKDPGDR